MAVLSCLQSSVASRIRAIRLSAADKSVLTYLSTSSYVHVSQLQMNDAPISQLKSTNDIEQVILVQERVRQTTMGKLTDLPSNTNEEEGDVSTSVNEFVESIQPLQQSYITRLKPRKKSNATPELSKSTIKAVNAGAETARLVLNQTVADMMHLDESKIISASSPSGRSMRLSELEGGESDLEEQRIKSKKQWFDYNKSSPGLTDERMASSLGSTSNSNVSLATSQREDIEVMNNNSMMATMMMVCIT